MALVWRGFAEPEQLRLWWISAALWLTVTVAIVVVNGPRLVRRPVAVGANEVGS